MDVYRQIVQRWQNLAIQNTAQLEASLQGFIVKFAYHSGKIENDAITFYDTREIFDKERVVNYTGDLRTLVEIKNAKDASTYLFESFAKRVPIDVWFIAKLQLILTKASYNTRRNRVGALSVDVPAAVDELVEELQKLPVSEPENLLMGAAYLQAKIEQVHPFAEGNSRIGRWLANYYLLLHDHPPVVFYAEDRDLYYRSLEAFTVHNDVMRLVDFLKTETVKSWNNPRFMR